MSEFRELREFDAAAVTELFVRLDRIEEQQKILLRLLMETKDALDAGISTLTADDAAVLVAVAAAGTATSTAFADLEAKIAANPTAPVSDFTDEVTVLAKTHTDFQAAIASLAAITAGATSADSGGAQVETPAPVDPNAPAA